MMNLLPQKYKMTICIAGKNKIAIEAISYLLEHYNHFKIVGIQNQSDDGNNSWQNSFAAFCLKNKVPLVILNDVYPVEELLFISLEFDKIIRTEKFKSSRLFNIHFSKLPAYKGMFTSIMPIINGETETGVTLHYINNGIDTGNIISQSVFNIPINATSRNIYELYLDHSIELFKVNVKQLIDNSVNGSVQSSIGSSYFSKKTIDFSNIVINLNKTAFEVHNQVRAFAFKEYQLPKVFNHFIYKSLITNFPSACKPGVIVFEDDSRIIITTIDYNIELFKDREADLMQCAQEGDILIFEEIKNSHFPVNVKTKQGWDVFIVACYYNQVEFVMHIVNAGWDCNTRNYKGTTALMYAMTAASRDGNISTFEFLANKADWLLVDDSGRDIISYAHEYNNKDVLTFIKNFT